MGPRIFFGRHRAEGTLLPEEVHGWIPAVDPSRATVDNPAAQVLAAQWPWIELRVIHFPVVTLLVSDFNSEMQLLQQE